MKLIDVPYEERIDTVNRAVAAAVETERGDPAADLAYAVVYLDRARSHAAQVMERTRQLVRSSTQLDPEERASVAMRLADAARRLGGSVSEPVVDVKPDTVVTDGMRLADEVMAHVAHDADADHMTREELLASTLLMTTSADAPKLSKCWWCWRAAGATRDGWMRAPELTHDDVVRHLEQCPNNPGASCRAALAEIVARVADGERAGLSARSFTSGEIDDVLARHGVTGLTSGVARASLVAVRLALRRVVAAVDGYEHADGSPLPPSVHHIRAEIREIVAALGDV